MDLKAKLSRKDFLFKLSIIGSVVLAVIAVAAGFFRYLFPPIKEKTYHKYLAAKTGEIPPGSSKEIEIAGKPVFVVHLEEGFKVFSGVCTHLGCLVRWEKEKSRFYCPCHQGIFNEKGEVTGGPPPEPLKEYEVELDKDLVYIYIEDKKEGPWT